MITWLSHTSDRGAERLPVSALRKDFSPVIHNVSVFDIAVLAVVADPEYSPVVCVSESAVHQVGETGRYGVEFRGVGNLDIRPELPMSHSSAVGSLHPPGQAVSAAS